MACDGRRAQGWPALRLVSSSIGAGCEAPLRATVMKNSSVLFVGGQRGDDSGATAPGTRTPAAVMGFQEGVTAFSRWSRLSGSLIRTAGLYYVRQSVQIRWSSPPHIIARSPWLEDYACCL